MRHLVYLLIVAVVFSFAAQPTLAQSSGNFAAYINTMKCSVNNQDGTLNGGFVSCEVMTDDGGITTTNCPQVEMLSTSLQTPNSSQTAILLGGSLGIGLYTKTKTKGKGTESSSATANGRVDVAVEICDEDGNNCTHVAPSPVTFGQRFQQLTVQLDDVIDACEDDLENECPPESVELVLSTIEMNHSNFVEPNPGGGVHTLKLTATVDGNTMADLGNNAEVGVCAGPGVFTVQQVKAFSQSGGIDIN